MQTSAHMDDSALTGISTHLLSVLALHGDSLDLPSLVISSLPIPGPHGPPRQPAYCPTPPDSCTLTPPHPRGLECKAPHSQHALCTHPQASWKNPELGLAPSFPCPGSSSPGRQLCSELHPKLSIGHFWDVCLMPFPPFNDRDAPYPTPS